MSFHEKMMWKCERTIFQGNVYWFAEGRQIQIRGAKLKKMVLKNFHFSLKFVKKETIQCSYFYKGCKKISKKNFDDYGWEWCPKIQF